MKTCSEHEDEIGLVGYSRLKQLPSPAVDTHNGVNTIGSQNGRDGLS
jgi:hypothetical protein